MKVEDAIEELLSQNGPCVKHRYDIMNLLARQQREIESLKSKTVEAVQFTGTEDSRQKIIKFLDTNSSDVLYYDSENIYGQKTISSLDITSSLWGGYLYKDYWLVKRNNEVVRLTNREYDALFGEE